MRLQLDADPEELCCKAHRVLGHLADHAELHDPSLADALRKAVPTPTVPSEHKAISELQTGLLRAYQEEMRRVVDQAVGLLEAEHGG